MATQRVEVPVGFESLAELDNGKLDLLLRNHLALIARDCINRPHEKKRRKVTLVFQAVPDLDGEACTVKLNVQCRSRVPDFQSREYEMRPANNGFHFNRDFPDSLDQQPLFDGKEE